MTFIRFHIDFKESASATVMMSYTATKVFVAFETAFSVVSIVAANSSSGNIFGRSYSISVPDGIESPFSVLEKNAPSTIVAIILSLIEPYET